MSMGKITRNKSYNETRHNKLPSTRPRGRPPIRRVIDLDSIPTSRNNNIQQEQHPLPEIRLPARQQGQPPPPPRNNDSSVSYEAGSSTTTTSTIITIKMTTITHTDANNNSTTTTTVTTDISPVNSNTISSDPATVAVETREMPPQIARFPPQITPIHVENNNNSNAINNTIVNNSDTVNTNTINADTVNIGTVNATDEASTANTSSTTNTSNAANTSNIADTVNTAANVTGVANTVNPVSTEILMSNNQQQHLAAMFNSINSITSNLGIHTINSTKMERTPSTTTINSNGTSSSPVLESSFVDSNTVASDNSYLMSRLSHSPMSNSPIVSSNAIPRLRYYRLPELNALGTVNDVWNEWNVGLGGNPSIIDLLETYGTKWATENKETLISRKKLIKEIAQRSADIGVDEAINELERMRNGNGLSWLSKRFGKKRTLSSAHHHNHNNHHHNHHYHNTHA